MFLDNFQRRLHEPVNERSFDDSMKLPSVKNPRSSSLDRLNSNYQNTIDNLKQSNDPYTDRKLKWVITWFPKYSKLAKTKRKSGK
jgi:hypothetical protein